MSDSICEGCDYYRTAKIVCVGETETREIRVCKWLGLEVLEIVVECDRKTKEGTTD